MTRPIDTHSQNKYFRTCCSSSEESRPGNPHRDEADPPRWGGISSDLTLAFQGMFHKGCTSVVSVAPLTACAARRLPACNILRIRTRNAARRFFCYLFREYVPGGSPQITIGGQRYPSRAWR